MAEAMARHGERGIRERRLLFERHRLRRHVLGDGRVVTLLASRPLLANPRS